MAAMARACKVLGVTPKTPLSEVKKKYRAMAAVQHPDVAGGDAALFKDVTGAYDTLRQHHADPTASPPSGADYRQGAPYQYYQVKRESMSFSHFCLSCVSLMFVSGAMVVWVAQIGSQGDQYTFTNETSNKAFHDIKEHYSPHTLHSAERWW